MVTQRDHHETIGQARQLDVVAVAAPVVDVALVDETRDNLLEITWVMLIQR